MIDALATSLFLLVKFLGFNEQVNSSWVLLFVECYFCGIICANSAYLLLM